MNMLEIQALDNGAHNNQTFHGVLPDGWAVIPDEMAVPDTFPFVDIEVEEVTHYKAVEVMQDVTKTREVPVFDDEGNPTFDEEGNPVTTTEEYTVQELVTVQEPYTVLTVASMTAGVVPEPEPEPEPAPTIEERVTTLEESNAEMTEALDLLLSGVTE